MKKIVECVPNFSEGQNKETIEAIAKAIRETEGCTLLDVDPGISTNRTVYTFVGSPEAVVEGALASARVAKELIDMRTQKGEHARMGAMDVCPFIPVLQFFLPIPRIHLSGYRVIFFYNLFRRLLHKDKSEYLILQQRARRIF